MLQIKNKDGRVRLSPTNKTEGLAYTVKLPHEKRSSSVIISNPTADTLE
jgi:hypothetical protein